MSVNVKIGNIKVDLKDVNKKARDPKSFIAECEGEYIRQLEELVQQVIKGKEKIVMLAGPSSSGKTTTANKLVDCFKVYGIDAHVVSLDDFFLGVASYPKLLDGTPDMETVEALDLPLINETFAALLANGEAYFPVFDFEKSCRSNEKHLLKLGERDILIVEGLHSLNPRLTDQLAGLSLYKAYVSTRTKYMYGDITALSPKNNRLIRRMVRDHNFRNKSPLKTIETWQDVLDGENKYIYPFRDSAQYSINSAHAYEGCVFHHYILPILKEMKDDPTYSDKVRELVEILEAFDDIEHEYIPVDSLLREFIG